MAEQSPLPVSAIVLTFNEELNIADCLESFAADVAEVHVVDSGSTDRTLDLVRRWTENIRHHPFESYSDQRNWAQDNLPLQHEWVLHIDADERVTSELMASLRLFFAGGNAETCDGAMFSRRTIFLGRWIRHGGHYPAYHVRLFRRDRGRCENRLYDQHFVVAGHVAQLTGDLIDVVTPELDSWSIKHLRWAGAEAREMLRRRENEPDQLQARLFGSLPEQRRWLKNRLYGQAPPFWRALFYFIYRYVVRRGFLDGTEGLLFHVLQGFWFRFYIDAKIWEYRRDIPSDSGADHGREGHAHTRH